MTQNTDTLFFSSDYMEGAHPAVLDALSRTNLVSTEGYGEDAYCRDAQRRILEACSLPDGEVRFLIGGTQTNQFVIDCLLPPCSGVLCPSSGHIAVHEAGAIEYCGHKTLPLPTVEGKISASSIRQYTNDARADANWEHMVMPGMVYISQPTEYGTLYSLEELEEISSVCREYGLPLFVDGARLAYALAAPENDVTLADLGRLCDVFYIGGTKCGLLFGEAVIFTRRGMVPRLTGQIKQHGALLAKGRLLGVQFQALFTDHLYEQIGETAIRCAARIREKLLAKGFELSVNSPTNQIFFAIDNSLLDPLSGKVSYGFMEKIDDHRSMIRFCTSWSTTEEKTDALLSVIDQMDTQR